VLGAAVLTGPASSVAQAAPSAEVVIPGVTTDVPVKSALINAGPHGYLRFEEGRGAIWRSYGAVADVQVDPAATPGQGSFEWGTGSDVVAQYRESTRTVDLRDMVTGETVSVPLPSGQTYLGAFGWNVLSDESTSGGRSFHVLDMQTGQIRDRLIEGLPAWTGSYAYIHGLGNADGMVMSYGGQVLWLDVTQRRAVSLPTGATLQADKLALTRDRLLVRANGKVSVFRRDDFSTPERVWPLADDLGTRLLGMVGNELIVARHDPALGELSPYLPVWRVDAEPMDGTPVRTLLAQSIGGASAVPDGGLLVHGAPNTSNWGVQLVEADDADRAVVTPETRIPSKAVPNTVRSLTFNQGRLTSVESVAATGRTNMYTRTAGPEGDSLVHGERKDRGWRLPSLPEECSRIVVCPQVEETGDGRIVYGGQRGTGQSELVVPLHRVLEDEQLPGTKIDVGTRSQGFVGSWGRWAVVYAMLAGGSPETRIVDTDTGQVTRKLAVIPFSLSGTTLWVREYSDTAVGYDIRTGARTHEAFIPSCQLEGAASVGRWLLWNCAGQRDDRGVYDLETRAITPLGIGYGAGARLGDGFVAYWSDGRLKVKDLRDGGTVHDVHADLRDYRTAWTVDATTGTIAWADTKGAIHLVGAGVATSALTVADSDVTTSQAVNGGNTPWAPRWWLSKPAASWTLRLTNKATGAVVRTLSGGKARGLVDVSWDGKDGSGRLAVNGAYVWTLTVQPADGQGAAATTTGTVSISGATPAWRDLVGDDGFGELLVQDSTGLVASYKGTGTGGVSSRQAGGVFAVGASLVPFGDVDGDRCNDVLVRLGNELRVYRPGCGKALTPAVPYTVIGTGWGQFNVLTSPGDVNGDGARDLIARQSTTGDMYFYAGTADHRFKAAVKFGTNWKTYTKVVGAGDLNGDGRGDLLGHDQAGGLWRYYGTANGGVTAGVKLASAWGMGYTTLVGVGDISGDGKPDLVARTTDGRLFRHSGTGNGTIAGSAQIGNSGWAAFKGLY
jgi:hypothetical protein